MKKLDPIAQVSFSNGSWMPDRDPSRIGVENFKTLQNLRYSDSHPIAVSGMRRVVFTPLGYDSVISISAGGYHTAGIESDGTCVAVGDNDYGQCDVTEWTGIIQISTGWYNTIGLKSDGTCVAVGWNGDNECNVTGWTGIIQTSAGQSHTVGLKSDGTCVAVGYNGDG